MFRKVWVAIGATALAGCGATKTVTTPAPQTSAAQATDTQPTTATPGPPVPLGQSVVVYGQVLNTQPPDAELLVTVKKVLRVATPIGAAYGVELTIKNIGPQVFNDALATDVQLIAASGQTGTPTVSQPDSGPCAANVNQDPNLAAGQSVSVCVTTDGPSGAKPAFVRFTPDSGTSMNFGEWSLS